MENCCFNIHKIKIFFDKNDQVNGQNLVQNNLVELLSVAETMLLLEDDGI